MSVDMSLIFKWTKGEEVFVFVNTIGDNDDDYQDNT